MTDVEVPRSAAQFAAKATAAGWEVTVTTAEAPEVDLETGQVKRRFTLEKDTREESDGKSVRVYGDAKRVQTAAVRCRRGADRLTAVWACDPDGDGKWKFDVALRRNAFGTLSSTAALAHVQEAPTRPCRWLPSQRRHPESGRRIEICQHHSETREARWP